MLKVKSLPSCRRAAVFISLRLSLIHIYRSPSNEKLPELNLITDLIPIESDRASSLSLVERLYLYFSKFTSSSSDLSLIHI